MLTFDEIIAWLREENPRRLSRLWNKADSIRRAAVGDDVYLRGLIEISNYCIRKCAYCGLRAGNHALTRYRMTAEEILACTHEAVRFGYGTVVLQSGEDPGITREWMADIVRRIKQTTPLAVTLSLGERSDEDFRTWRDAGADRYLLRFETSNPTLYRYIHPARSSQPESDRIGLLHTLREVGYEIGSGVMIGIPGQSHRDLANDLELFRRLDLDMIGVGPFIPHPRTPLAPDHEEISACDDQVPNSELMTYKVVALARVICPETNIPSTTALASLNRAYGREMGLMRGANIVMPNITPPWYRVHYEIYPGKASSRESPNQSHKSMQRCIEAIGRHIGVGPGISKTFTRRS